MWNTALSFITWDFPGYQPVSSGRELPPGVSAVRTNLSQYKPPGTGPNSQRRPGSVGASTRHLGDGEALLIRLGAQRASPTPDRRFIGYAPGMSAGELRDSARMYWRLGTSGRGRSATWSSQPASTYWMPVRSSPMA